MASPTRWTWVWVNSGSWWWTGRPGVLLFMGSQRVGHDWVTELTCKVAKSKLFLHHFFRADMRFWADVRGQLPSRKSHMYSLSLSMIKARRYFLPTFAAFFFFFWCRNWGFYFLLGFFIAPPSLFLQPEQRQKSRFSFTSPEPPEEVKTERALPWNFHLPVRWGLWWAFLFPASFTGYLLLSPGLPTGWNCPSGLGRPELGKWMWRNRCLNHGGVYK